VQVIKGEGENGRGEREILWWNWKKRRRNVGEGSRVVLGIGGAAGLAVTEGRRREKRGRDEKASGEKEKKKGNERCEREGYSDRDLIPVQHQYNNYTTTPHMRVGPSMWDPPSCEGLLYSCCISVVNLTFSIRIKGKERGKGERKDNVAMCHLGVG